MAKHKRHENDLAGDISLRPGESLIVDADAETGANFDKEVMPEPATDASPPRHALVDVSQAALDSMSFSRSVSDGEKG